MDTNQSDYSQPPAWILNLYKDAPKHVLVTSVLTPPNDSTYMIQEIDLSKVNLFEAAKVPADELPTKGEEETFEGTALELYHHLEEMDAKVVLGIFVEKKFSKVKEIPMAFGYSSIFKKVEAAMAEYRCFRRYEKEFLEKNTASSACNFIKQHPMFWYAKEGRNGRPYLVTGKGWDRLDFLMMSKKREDGTLEDVVTIETGPGYYHDLNLDVYAPSFDEAIVQLAKLINEHYDSHGGFTDKTKKEPNDNFFRKWDEEDEAKAEEQQTTLEVEE